MSTLPTRKPKPERTAVLFVILALAPPSLLSGGCSQTIKTFRLQSALHNFDLSPRLCDLLGSRIAIVPGNAFAHEESDAEHTFRTTPSSSYASAAASGTLRYRVDNGPWFTASGRSELPPESTATLARMLRRLGFVVVDRQNVTAVLEEQDLSAVFGEAVQSVGRLVGADVLAVTSVLLTPQMHFSSYSGAYAFIGDILVREQIHFIEVSTGTNLGSSTWVYSLFSICEYESVQARALTGALEVRIEWFLAQADGTWKKHKRIDFTEALQRVMAKEEAKTLAEWRELCGSARSGNVEAKRSKVQ